MSEVNHTHHEINYIEFSVSDMKVAQSFYKTAFGWQFNDYGPDYAGIRKHESDLECGGLCVTSDVRTGGPLVILYSVDLEQSFRDVHRAGGQITKEIVSFPGGRRFQFSDPDGNELAVWSDRQVDGSRCS